MHDALLIVRHEQLQPEDKAWVQPYRLCRRKWHLCDRRRMLQQAFIMPPGATWH